MDTIVIGSFVLNFSLFMWLVSAISGLFMLKRRWKASGIDVKYSEKFTSSLLIGVLIWKFSFVLFDFQSVISYPMSVLYFSGGDRGIMLGAFAATLYFVIKMKQDRTPFSVNIDALFNGWLAGNVMFYSLSLISSQALAWDNVGYLTIHFFIWLNLNVNRSSARSRGLLHSAFVWYFVGMIAIPFLNKSRSLMWIGLSAWQIIFVCLFLTFMFTGNWVRKREGVK